MNAISLPPDLASVWEKPVAVLGAGISGRAAAALIGRMGGEALVYDEREGAGERRCFGPSEAAEHALAVVSPGFRPGHPWLIAAERAGCRCLGELDFASRFWPGEVIAVTGTNGKTTLAELLATALWAAGEPACTTGNIGVAFSSAVLNATGPRTAICEVSSFQAESLACLRPSAVLWTNLAEDHLDRHGGLEPYFRAKWRLVERVSPGPAFLGSSAAAHARRFLGPELPPAVAAIETQGREPDPDLEGTVFATYPQRENFLLAQAYWRWRRLPPDILGNVARNFAPRRHRLARIGSFGRVNFWNDSKATNFGAVEAALSGFSEPVCWIGGGRSKGGDLQAFAARIAPKIRQAFLIGETGPELARALEESGVRAACFPGLDLAVAAAGQGARPEGDVVFSPGFASFDMFRDFAERGDCFERFVGNLSRNLIFE